MKLGTKLLIPCALIAQFALAEQLTPNGRYVATAYSQSGETASGVITKRHIVAADPDYLPIGTRIKVKHAGRYSGEYVVADTGEKIVGRRLDIFIPSTAACKSFGRKNVKVSVVQMGDNTHSSAKQAQAAVTQDVKKDLEKKVVGNAATQDDWTARKTVVQEADKEASQADKEAKQSAAGATGSAPASTPSGAASAGTAGGSSGASSATTEKTAGVEAK